MKCGFVIWEKSSTMSGEEKAVKGRVAAVRKGEISGLLINMGVTLRNRGRYMAFI